MGKTKNQIIIVGFIFHLLAAFFSVGYHQCDELFQVFEFAGYKLGLNAATDLPWEFHSQMRSGLQPLVVYFFTVICKALYISSPFQIAFILRIVQSIFSFTAMVLLLRMFEKELESPGLKRAIWFSGLLFWCIPYFHARLSSENVAGTLFIFSLVITNRNSGRSFFVAGMLAGLAFIIRFQTGFMVAGLLGWLLFIKKTPFKLVVISFAGFAAALSMGLLSDKWLYGKWVLSWWNYIDLNLFQDKASQFGREPVYFYLEQSFLQLIPPFSIFIIVAVILFWVRFYRHAITWITLPFVLLHFMVPHKELRFLFPILNFIPIMVIMSFQSLTKENQAMWNKKWIIRFALLVNGCALLLFSLKPADNISFSLKKIYDETAGDSIVMLFNKSDPYNKQGSLNYFHKPGLVTISADSLRTFPRNAYFYSHDFSSPRVIIIKRRAFVKVYASYPAWFTHLNFNGWLERTVQFSIYKAYS